MRYPSDALKVNEAKKLAGTAKAVLFAQDEDRELDGSKANAFLHAYWNAATAYRIGAELTEKFTTAHETYSRRQYIKNKLEEVDTTTGFTIGQNVEMDMHNNAVGRKIAAKMPDTEEKIHAELLKEYGSEEAIAMQLSMYPNFEEADLLLLRYTEKAMEDGSLVWLYNKE